MLFGVTPAGKPVGQAVTDRTLEELAQEFQGFEPPIFPMVERVGIGPERDVLVVTVARAAVGKEKQMARKVELNMELKRIEAAHASAMERL